MTDINPRPGPQAPSEIVLRALVNMETRDTTYGAVADGLLAAITAAGYVVVLREPDEVMLQAGLDETSAQAPMDAVDRWMLTNIWQTMIEAFLSQGLAGGGR